MLKILTQDLLQTVQLLQKTSTDAYLQLNCAGDQLKITFENADRQLVTVTIYCESLAIPAKVDKAEGLRQVLQGLKP